MVAAPCGLDASSNPRKRMVKMSPQSPLMGGAESAMAIAPATTSAGRNGLTRGRDATDGKSQQPDEHALPSRAPVC